MTHRRHLSFGYIVSTTSLAFVVSQLDVSIVNIALPAMAKAFSAGISELQWVADAYTVAFAALMLSAGGLSDRLGSKRIFQLGLLLFGIASTGCGLAWSAGSLIAFRALQGMGAATMIPSSLSILNQAFAHEPDQRAHAVALWTMAGGISIAAGPILGGLFLHISSWRMIFFVNIPICLAGVLLAAKIQDGELHPNRGLDITGQLVWMLALTAFIAGIIEWQAPGIRRSVVMAALVLSVLLLLLFLRIEKRARSPILPLDLFRIPVFNVLLLLGVIVNNAYYGTVFVLSLYLQNTLHYTSIHAGLAFLPLTGGFVVSNFISGRLMAAYGIRLPLLGGALLAAVGYAGLLLAGTATPYWQLFIPFVIIPMGMGIAVPAMTTGILSSVEKSRSGTASAVLNTIRQAAGAMGVAVFGAMANGGPRNIAWAARISGLISCGSLLLAAVLIGRYIRKSQNSI
ncbi:MAG TPA: MFS transporter [Chitinophaga sp.]|uniref:MFS transporter n=1 Tax=Chitinophaga sp. TaxID=1869181 RepID=UPI002DBC4CB5|nr:MFS transporter [Chitinophaga sp.]HEU4551574.1 MFS transporter [Chitinophaga sp.]